MHSNSANQLGYPIPQMVGHPETIRPHMKTNAHGCWSSVRLPAPSNPVPGVPFPRRNRSRGCVMAVTDRLGAFRVPYIQHGYPKARVAAILTPHYVTRAASFFSDLRPSVRVPMSLSSELFTTGAAGRRTCSRCEVNYCYASANRSQVTRVFRSNRSAERLSPPDRDVS